MSENGEHNYSKWHVGCFLNRAKDWGKTEYKVIRNWTPRIPQPAGEQSHQSSGHSAAGPTGDILDEIEDNEGGDNNTGTELQVVFPLQPPTLTCICRLSVTLALRWTTAHSLMIMCVWYVMFGT